MDLTVAELFAGVGGFRIGLEKAGWETVWANQWEPSRKPQHAFDCYVHHYGESKNHVNEDINKVPAETIPDHSLLVGGFPCQDYSVAATLAKGIQGKKGVLWWDILRVIETKKPKFVLLENVDRLLKSPAKQRGRDFSIMLSCLNALGYVVEWRVINAAEYGFPQRRRRVFVFASLDRKVNSEIYFSDKNDILLKDGFFANPFPNALSGRSVLKEGKIGTDLVDLTNNFSFNFENTGYCANFKFKTIRTEAKYDGPKMVLGDVIQPEVDKSFYLSEDDLEKWDYMKGAKKEKRKTREGFEYHYAEGAIPYPDALDKPSRTMLTSESSKNRSTHVIKDPETNKLRLLIPEECELLNGFPKGWTKTGMPEKFRYFCMGNALVVGIIEKLGKQLINMIT